jgi:ABC-type multidrug transport system fused ATPase/permease subunit
MMKMNGLRMLNYWIMNFAWNFTLYFIAAFIFFAFGYFILDASFFTNTSFGNIFFMLVGWGLSQVSLGFFFQTFLSKAKTATIVGYILSVWTTMIGISFNFALFPPPKVLPVGLRFYPPFAFCRLIYDYSQACASNACYQSLSDINSEMVDCMLGLYLGAIFFMVLSIYLHAIWPKEYGIQYHPLFCLKRYRNKQINFEVNSAGQDEALKEDEDSKKEKDFVDNIESGNYVNYPLIIKKIRKVYKSEAGRPPKVAVQNFSLHIKHGEMFGLLGPNGAGKTTLISMLTGLYPPEAGNAWVAGFDILNQIDEVRREMGVCPQFDLLWPELTIAEHLYFYARVRGVQKEREKEVIEKAANEVKLGNFLGFTVKQLSGKLRR